MREGISASRAFAPICFVAIALAIAGCADAPSDSAMNFDNGQVTSPIADEHGHLHDDGEFILDIRAASCIKATKAQKDYVNSGNKLYSEFLKQCANKTGASPWCAQLTRPNPDFIDEFYCTYGSSQPHRFIHPDPSTWENAFEAVRIIEEMQTKGIAVRRIYNWWRPEPYNKNVDGAAGRHPFGTSIDVQFETQRDKNLAFRELCRIRKAGRIKAIGYYSGLGLHFGVDDKTPNTWGNSCS